MHSIHGGRADAQRSITGLDEIAREAKAAFHRVVAARVAARFGVGTEPRAESVYPETLPAHTNGEVRISEAEFYHLQFQLGGAREQVRQLTEALFRFGEHKHFCPAQQCRPCTCGYMAALETGEIRGGQ